MPERYDVVVAGAGPAGSAAAAECARSGLKTLLLEEQAHTGHPVQCAGLLSASAFAECRVSDAPVLNTVTGARLRAGTADFSFHADRVMAYVVDRAMLDRELCHTAVDAGADLRLKTRAASVSVRDHQLVTRGIRGHEDIRYTVLIAADGPRSTLSRQAGLSRARIYLSGLQCDIPYETERDAVTIYPNASPDFFGWIIPLQNGRARVGLCGITGVQHLFDRFVHSFSRDRVQFSAGTIPLGPPGKTYTEGLMVVGDAAALAKPTSGGGVYTGVRSARHAASVAVDSCETGRTDPGFLSTYQDRWQSDFGRELAAGMHMLRVRRTISSSQMEHLLGTMSHPAIRDLITRKGDMDRPLSLATALMIHPRMIPAAGILVQAWMRSMRDRKRYL